MRIAVGDIHGRTNWKEALKSDFTEMYFVGDYFDSFDPISATEQIYNFLEICELARKDPRVKLCLGNHDYHYLSGLGRNEEYSGFQSYKRYDIRIEIEKNIDLLKIVYITDDKIIISHAGVTKTFLAINDIHLEDINSEFISNRSLLKFVGYNVYGDSVESSPIWVRPYSLLDDKIDGYKQIVGHTRMKLIQTIQDCTFIDVEGKDFYTF